MVTAKNDKKGINPTAAAIAGVALGAAAATLANKGTRDKLVKKANQMKKAGEKKLVETQKKVNKAKEKSKKKLAEKLTAEGK